ncbi:hypothetical protein PV04_01862 [Phialophora macrospora]|uniref:Clr5 domain-containing protein n=1 Tax=Phialophora macrospora TaxID=1851006 RepID=A0A0D2GN01_9EURO|nr:hypothetical protein PV04_01862 [Phialophora macrospora]
MIRTKITEWDFKKNFKKREHETAAIEANRLSDLGMPLPIDIQINGRPCDWDRVNRHYGREHNGSRLRSTSSWHAFLSRVALKTTPTEYNLEISLKQVKDYWSTVVAKDESRASVRAKRNSARTRYDPHNIEIGFFGGLNLIDQGHAEQGWQEINEMCGAVIDTIRLQEPSLLLSIISLFSASLWIDHHDLFLLVAKYVLAACDMLLTRSHPITTVLTTLINLPQTAAVVDDFAEIAYQVMVDIVFEHPDQVKLDRYYTYCVEEYLISKVKSRLERREAYELVSTKLAHYKRTLGPRSRHTISMRSQLAKMHLNDARKQQPETRERKEAEDKGMAQLHEIVKQGEKYPHDRYRIGTYSMAARDLARFYFGKQDFRNAQVYYCKAVLWGAEKFGRMHSHVALVLREFRALQRMAELDIDIEVEAAFKPVPNAEEDQPQERHSELVEFGIGDVQGGNLDSPHLEEFPGETETFLDECRFDPSPGHTTNNGTIASDILDWPFDGLDQDSPSHMMPGELLDGHSETINNSQSPILDIPEDISMFYEDGTPSAEGLFGSCQEGSQPGTGSQSPILYNPHDVAMFSTESALSADVLFGSCYEDHDVGDIHMDEVDQLLEEW